MSNYQINGISTSTIIDPLDVTKTINLDMSGSLPNTTTNFKFNRSADQDLIFPSTVSDQLVCLNTTGVLQNKTLVGSTTFVTNPTDPTRRLMFGIDSTPNSTTV